MIIKQPNHDHFWIADGYLFESYNTIRGLRFRNVAYVPNMPNEDSCSDACIKYINMEYFDYPTAKN